MDRYEAARALQVADADVLELVETEHGTEVLVRDGGRRLLAGGRVFALDDHPANRSRPRFVPPAEREKSKPAAKPTARRAAKKG